MNCRVKNIVDLDKSKKDVARGDAVVFYYDAHYAILFKDLVF